MRILPIGATFENRDVQRVACVVLLWVRARDWLLGLIDDARRLDTAVGAFYLYNGFEISKRPAIRGCFAVEQRAVPCNVNYRYAIVDVVRVHGSPARHRTRSVFDPDSTMPTPRTIFFDSSLADRVAEARSPLGHDL